MYDEIQQDTLSHATPFIRQDLDYPFGKNADSVSLQANCVSVLLLLLHILYPLAGFNPLYSNPNLFMNFSSMSEYTEMPT